MKKPSKIQFVDRNLEKAFKDLKNSKTENEKRLYQWLVKAFEDIKGNSFCGVQIPKKLIPKDYFRKYGVDNLWKH